MFAAGQLSYCLLTNFFFLMFHVAEIWSAGFLVLVQRLSVGLLWGSSWNHLMSSVMSASQSSNLKEEEILRANVILHNFQSLYFLLSVMSMHSVVSLRI